MAEEKAKGTGAGGTSKAADNEKTLSWKYTYYIAVMLIGGYLGLVVILLIAIIFNSGAKAEALNALETITTVFGPWIAALVAYYFAQKQAEKMSEQLGEAQKAITASIKPDVTRILEGKTAGEIMDRFDPDKHKIPHPKLPFDSTAPLDDSTIDKIASHTGELIEKKGVKCFVVYTSGDKVEGILKPIDIKKIYEYKKEVAGKPVDQRKKLEDFTTDRIRIVKVTPEETLLKILPRIKTYDVLPVCEGENIVGFVYRDAVFGLISGIS